MKGVVIILIHIFGNQSRDLKMYTWLMAAHLNRKLFITLISTMPIRLLFWDTILLLDLMSATKCLMQNQFTFIRLSGMSIETCKY